MRKSYINNSNDLNNLFGSWVDAHTDSMVSLAYIYVKDTDICMDIVQDAFFSAYKSIHTYNQSKNPKTWLSAIVKNRCIDYLRKEKTKQKYINAKQNEFREGGAWNEEAKLPDWGSETNNLMDNTKFIGVFHNCVANLPEYMSSVISLRYIEGEDAESICSDLEITKSNYWQIVHRAKLKLRKCLNSNWFEKGNGE